MLNIFKKIFINRFCCGWIVGIGCIYLMMLINSWWSLILIPIFYLHFRFLAFKYLDE